MQNITKGKVCLSAMTIKNHNGNMPIPELIPNRFSYKPRGDSQKFESHFAKLKDVMSDRFNSRMKFSENTITWDPENFCVVVMFPADAPGSLLEAVSNYLVGAFDILGF